MRRRCRRNAGAPFCREVCLLTSPETSVVPRGMARVQLLNDGYIISGVQFQKSWTAQEVMEHIRYIYELKLQNSTEICLRILRASNTHLVKPTLERGIEMSGSVLCMLFKDRVIYIRPSVNLSQLDQNSTHLTPVLASSPAQTPADNDGPVLHEWINAGTPDVYYRIIQLASDEHSGTDVLIRENIMALSDTEEEEPVMLRSPSKNTSDNVICLTF
ncbi:hypothetical protein KOW79_018807 [Hemibagrus wyckioides]|uniref:Uncharacterized protein n=1 Tax=Hemibagrus wyckioides TaxID=337641 RepID=A0A9D3N8V4_9TELE|nr:hypothetical protein KOW79_018807 [Hemibagrus wyckioides]